MMATTTALPLCSGAEGVTRSIEEGYDAPAEPSVREQRETLA
jgi:hypothetical protein